MSCHGDEISQNVRPQSDHKIIVALAGNANVGKSVIFNQLTGLHQHVGNWPGKTVKKAEGTLSHRGHVIDIVDLPGIYSLSPFSIEELVSREFIAVEHPDAIINVVDASALERNLFFTLQLMELEPPLIIALNQVDIAERRGIKIDHEKLSSILGIPVVQTVAVRNIGLQQLMDEVINQVESHRSPATPPRFGYEVESRLERIIGLLTTLSTPYPLRWLAIKLTEGDEEIEDSVYREIPQLRKEVISIRSEIEQLHGHNAASVISSERYALASKIASEVSLRFEQKTNWMNGLVRASEHPFLGYVFMVGIVVTMFYSIFAFGDYTSKILGLAFDYAKVAFFESLGKTSFTQFIWSGLLEGLIAGVTIALPYIVPFFLALSLLEDSGYLARVAFLMDSAMHKIGLHGKGFIPMMLGFGCNVPACLGCSIMETERERLICAFVSSLVPCAARSIVIMGLVATYMGFEWAAVLYLIDFALIFILGRLAFKAVPGEPVGLIMEMPTYKFPSPKMTAQRTWFRLKGFVYEAFPIMVAGNLVIQIANLFGVLGLTERLFSPVTVWWLGLPSAVGVVLIFGVLRKELTLILLAGMMGTSNFAAILTPIQMFVFAFVVMIYIPCIATISVLVREFGLKSAAIISSVEIALAIGLGGIIFRVLLLLGLS